MLADKLKEQTRVAHADLENKLLTHIQLVSGKQQYCALLSLMYGFHAAIEQQLEPFHNSLPEYGLRKRSHAILNDLQVLSHTTAALPVCNNLPVIDTVPAALGALYVLEGSTLGGRIISKMLLKQVPEAENAMSFFQGYNENTGVMWQKFKEHLHETVSAAGHASAERAANETFITFKNWINSHDAAKL